MQWCSLYVLTNGTALWWRNLCCLVRDSVKHIYVTENIAELTFSTLKQLKLHSYHEEKILSDLSANGKNKPYATLISEFQSLCQQFIYSEADHSLTKVLYEFSQHPRHWSLSRHGEKHQIEPIQFVSLCTSDHKILSRESAYKFIFK